MVRLTAFAAIVCAATWVGLLAGIGNVGLQRSVAVGAATLLERPFGLLLAAGLAFAATGLLVRQWHLRRRDLFGLLVAVLVGDVVGAFILAPLAVGELTPADAPIVFLPLTALALQPLAVVAATLAFGDAATPRSERRRG